MKGKFRESQPGEALKAWGDFTDWRKYCNIFLALNHVAPASTKDIEGRQPGSAAAHGLGCFSVVSGQEKVDIVPGLL